MKKDHQEIEGKLIPQISSAKVAFICCFIAGYLAHLFAFTNIIPNSDGISRVFEPQQMTISGRWFLHYATIFNGFVQAPAVIGFFSVLFLSFSAALTVYALQIQHKTIGALTGILMIVFPSVAFTFLFMFTASAYCFGILLAVLSFYLISKKTRAVMIPAAFLLACAVATYQAYYAVAVSLSLICILLAALDKEYSVRDILKMAGKYLAYLVLGLVFYYAVLIIFLRVKKLTLIDYRGISDMTKFGMLGKIVSRIPHAYLSFARFLLSADRSYSTWFFVCLNIAFILLGLLAFIGLLRRMDQKKRSSVCAVFIVGVILFPLAINLTDLMGVQSEIVLYSFVFVYIFALALVDRWLGADVNSQREARSKILLTVTVCLSVMLCVFWVNTDNLAYTASATAHRATESFATRLVQRVESTQGYDKNMEVIIIGGFPKTSYHTGVEAFKRADTPADSILVSTKTVYYYLNDWLNVPWREPDEETLQAVSDSELFQAMPIYPDDGSIVIADGRVIVKLADKYIPKELYEIQYENRR